MRTFFRNVYFIYFFLFFAACYKAPNPKVDLPDTDLIIADTLKGYFTCDKKESELKTATASSKKLVVEESINSQETEHKDCDGKTISSKVEPVDSLDKTIEIEAPEKLQGAVTYAQVDNERTCSTHLFDAVKGSIHEGTIAPQALSAVDASGTILLKISDSTMIISGLYLNVTDGQNPLKITYYGKCLKQKEKPDPSLKSTYYRCEEAEVLGTQEILLTLDIKRPVIDGVRQVKSCRQLK